MTETQQEALATGSKGRIKVLNPPWTGNGIIRRKVANFYVNEGRATWVGFDLWMKEDHPKNIAANERKVATIEHRNDSYDAAVACNSSGGYGRPDLKVMRSQDPERYARNWVVRGKSSRAQHAHRQQGRIAGGTTIHFYPPKTNSQ